MRGIILRIPMLMGLSFATASGCGSQPPPIPASSVVIESAEPVSPATSTGHVKLEGGVGVQVGRGMVTIPSWVELDEGWLEVAACRQGTREHETVVATTCLPSVVHAAMLLAGFEPGSPAWYRSDGSSGPATGDPVQVEILVEDASGVTRVLALADAVDDERGDPDLKWVFAGSSFRPNPPAMGPGEYYTADYAGTIVGLTTFGDEVVAAVEIRSPEIGIDAPVWKIRPGVLPPPGTRVTLVLRRPDSE